MVNPGNKCFVQSPKKTCFFWGDVKHDFYRFVFLKNVFLKCFFKDVNCEQKHVFLRPKKQGF